MTLNPCSSQQSPAAAVLVTVATVGPNDWTMGLTYRRLDPLKREIRLLEIHSARNITDTVECRLVTLRLTEDLEYIALSSLYGDASETDKIVVGGRAVSIPTHISQALKHVRAVFYPTISQRFQRTPARRPHGAPRWLRQLFGLSTNKDGVDVDRPRALRVWVDLLCVNQHDDYEKSKQLVEMRQIYSSAELVVGWLGEKTEHTDVAMATLAEIEDAMPAHWGDPGDREKHPQDYSPTHRWAASITHIWAEGAGGEIPFLMPHWIGCNDFMTRQYFQRRWILEELALSRFPTFLIGDTVVPWKQVLRLNRMMEEFKYHPSDVFPAHLSAMIADLPLETAHKLLDEFAKREALEEAKILRETGRRAESTSTRDTE